ncbi:hypothetical protein [Nocardiopsis lucentensis]|uniref:hypothetical protein n=1 Tax=Nocardiopsis lucentensis TaxID=53441 RepID=UPI00036988F1|nr:hypothetical protein [Nocardiopsis lucentensis]
MLPEPLLAAVAAGAGVIAQAAGTGLWHSILPRIEEWFAHLGERRARALNAQLGATNEALEAAPEDDSARKDAEDAWKTRLQDVLMELDESEQIEFAGLLTRLRDEVDAARSADRASAGDNSVAAGGNINLNARDSAVAVVRNEGGIHVNPPQPGPDTTK